jgi:trehalose 6-phosphate phosphatase
MTTVRKDPSAPTQYEFALQQIIDRVAQSQTSALLLDYDGTLAPFRVDRQQAFPYSGVKELLQEIMICGRTRVVVITGRSAHETVFLLGTNPIPEVWGSHGLEHLRRDGSCQMPQVHSHVTQALSEAGQWLVDNGLQHRTEFKFGGIALHWRGLPETAVAEIRDKVVRAWLPIAQRASLSLLEFDGGVEMRMSDVDKGDVVRTIGDEIRADAPIAYLGDDTTDERAFRALGTRGVSILVRPEWRKTSAQLWLKPPDELLDFLRQWRQACCAPKAKGREKILSH